MTALSPSASSPSAISRVRAWVRARNIPPVYGILVIIFLVSILLDLFFGIDDQLFIFNPVSYTHLTLPTSDLV